MQKPYELMKGGTEHGMQRAVFAWCNFAMYRGFEDAWNDACYDEPTPLAGYLDNPRQPLLRWYHAIHNQGHGDAIRGGQAKAEGVKRGVPDTFLPVPRATPGANWHGLYIENKLPKYAKHKDGGLSGDQIECIKFLRWAGYAVVVSHDWSMTCRTLQTYIETGNVLRSLY